MQMNLDTCAMTAMRSVEHLWRACSNSGGVGADHNSLIVFQIRDNRRSAFAIGNLLSRKYVDDTILDLFNSLVKFYKLIFFKRKFMHLNRKIFIDQILHDYRFNTRL